MTQNRAMTSSRRSAAGLSSAVVVLGSGMVPVAAQLTDTAGTAHALVIVAMILMIAAIVTLSVLAGASLRASRDRSEPSADSAAS